MDYISSLLSHVEKQKLKICNKRNKKSKENGNLLQLCASGKPQSAPKSQTLFPNIQTGVFLAEMVVWFR